MSGALLLLFDFSVPIIYFNCDFMKNKKNYLKYNKNYLVDNFIKISQNKLSLMCI